MMDRPARVAGAVAIAAGCLIGCMESKRPLKYLGDADLEHYKDVSTQVDYAHVNQPVADEAQFTEEPRRIGDPRKDEIWDVHLSEVLHIALANSEVIRSRGQFLSTANPLLTNPDFVPSTLDPAIQNSGALVGTRGVEAALSDFDTNFTTAMTWGRNESVQNNLFLSGGLPPGSTLTDETGAFSSRLDKSFANGGSFAVVHNWNYSGNNVPSRLFNSTYVGLLQAEYRHPLLAGAGTEFTRIAGPIGRNFQQVFGVNQGVVIARINNDISIADFEMSVRNLLKDAEDIYWDLYLAYRVYDTEVVARDSALESWRFVKAKEKAGLAGGGAADEAQARDNYFESRARAESALADMYQSEGELRRLLGLPVNDGRIFRPVDEPLTGEFVPEWHISLAEALTRRVELRRQKWNIKSLELQLKAAESLVRPRLDFVSNYRVNGFGDRLFGENDSDGVTPQGLRSGFESVTQGDQTGWNLGFELTMPLGFRAAHAQVRNLELRVSKARSNLSAQELEISHELSNAFQGVDRWYRTAQTNFNRRKAAADRVAAFEALYRAGGGGGEGQNQSVNLDLVLRSQVSLAQAEVAYYRSIVEYNKSIAGVQFRKGTLLEENNVHLSEGQWEPKAYEQALRRAWARSHAVDAKRVHTEPAEFVTDSAGTVNIAVPMQPGQGNGDAAPPAPANAEPYEPETAEASSNLQSLFLDADPTAAKNNDASGDFLILPARRPPTVQKIRFEEPAWARPAGRENSPQVATQQRLSAQAHVDEDMDSDTFFSNRLKNAVESVDRP